MEHRNDDPLAGIDLHRLLERPPVELDPRLVAEGLEGKRLLITGAGGSIGSALAELLLGFEPAELTLLEHHENSLFDLRQRLTNAHPGGPLRFVLADVRDRPKLQRVLAACRPAVVFHLAAYKHVHLAEENPDQATDVNVLATLGVAREALEVGVDRLVYTSTDKAVNPPSVYGATKRAAELTLLGLAEEEQQTRLRVVRLVNTLGAQGGVIRTFARQIRGGQAVTITDDSATRYWISMAEATGILALAGGWAGPEKMLLLDMGEPVSLDRVARHLWSLLRPEASFQSVTIGMRPGERRHEQLSYPHEVLVPGPWPGVLAVREREAVRPSLVEVLQHLRALEEMVREGDLAALRTQLFDLVRVRAAALGA